MRKQIIIFITSIMLTMTLTACTLPEPSSSQELYGAPPAEEFSTAKEAVEQIKAVKATGADRMVHPDDYKLYEKDHIYLLTESPLSGFEQTSIKLVDQGVGIIYRKDRSEAIFSWFQGYEDDERIENLIVSFSLERYKDTKFFCGKKINDIFIYWWENGDQFSFMYPADTNIAPEDVIEHLEVEKYDL